MKKRCKVISHELEFSIIRFVEIPDKKVTITSVVNNLISTTNSIKQLSYLFFKKLL